MLVRKVGPCYFLSILLITAGPGFSQTGTGNIQGVVKDATGAIVPSAKVTIVHTATGGQTQTQTNEVGFYFFPRFKWESIKSPSNRPAWIRGRAG